MRNERGFTLTDLMAGLAMSAVLIVLIAALITTVNRHFFETRERLAAEQAASRAEMLLKLMFTQATNIQYTYTGNWNLGSGFGQILEMPVNTGGFTFDTIAAPGADWTTLAAFSRETSFGTSGIDLGAIQGTALYYRRPVAGATGTGTCGVIFISDGQGGVTPTTATYSSPYIDRISYLSFKKHQHDANNASDMASSLDVELRIRYHYLANGLTNWCPQADTTAGVSGCNNNAPWNDIDRQFNILLRNNLLHAKGTNFGLDSAVTAEERELGSLYFFQPVLPVK